MELATLIYKITSEFPKNELYGLSSQMNRSAVSIPSNIAEGRSRGSRRDFANFLHIAMGSLSELETQIELSKRLSFIDALTYNKVNSLTAEIGKMLNKMLSNLKANS